MSLMQVLLMLLVFGSVVALVLGITSIVRADLSERVKTRLLAMKDVEALERSTSAIRARYLKQLTPLERWVEELPGMDALERLSEQAGKEMPAYRLVLTAITVGFVVGFAVAFVVPQVGISLLIGAIAGSMPIVSMLRARKKRLAEFEAQLPDALDLMSRSLRAGNPLLEAFKFIADEMPAPISVEFGRTWSHVNYGVNLKAALYDLVEHAPSVSLRALVTAILVQRETGGNLAEVLDRIALMLRARVRFGRRLKTLTAEGRISAIFLVLVPFVLAGVLSITSPQYLPMLFKDPWGQNLMIAGVLLMGVGIYWVLRTIRIRV